MLSQQYFDLRDDTGRIDFTAFRCTMCGEVIDPVILRNRISTRPDLTHGSKQRKFMQRLSFGRLREAADRKADLPETFEDEHKE